MIPSRRALVSLFTAVALILVGDLSALVVADGGDAAVQTAPGDSALATESSTVEAPTTTTTPTVPPTTSGSKAQAGGRAKSTLTTVAPTTTQPPATGKKAIRFELSVSPACVVRGGVMTVTLRTEPEAIVAIRVSDGAGQEIGGRSEQVGADGVLSAKFAVPAAAEPGLGLVLAAGGDLSGNGAQQEAQFQIPEVAC